MDRRVFRSGGPYVGRPLHELRQPWRAFNVWLVRRTVMRHPPEGLLGIGRDGHAIWAPGYPKAHTEGG
jgi:hypothetical protein